MYIDNDCGCLVFDNYHDFLEFTRIEFVRLAKYYEQNNSQSNKHRREILYYQVYNRPYSEWCKKHADKNAIREEAKKRLKEEGLRVWVFEDYYFRLRNRALLRSRDKKRCRIEKRYNIMLDKYEKNGGYLLFVTFTFNDNALQKTTYETRRRAVSRFIKNNCVYAVANIDYGDENGREHYHAIIYSAEPLDCSKRKYGALNWEHIRTKGRPKKLRAYLTKISNHAIKEGTTDKRLLYIGF